MLEMLKLYQSVRAVPDAAKKEIKGGRMNGKTDINPMWRIEKLTEMFGPCGIGWKYVITKQWTEHGADGTIAAYVNIDLFYKWNDAWSDAVPGTGGNMFVAKESSGLYTSDECYKMALTDAISVSCKAIGMGADVYWSSGRTKYDGNEQPSSPATSQQTTQRGGISEKQVKRLYAIAGKADIDPTAVLKVIVHDYKKTNVEDLTREEYDDICGRLEAKA